MELPSALLCNPKLNKNHHSPNTLFNHLFNQKGITGMKVWVLVISHSYMIPEHFYTISNTFIQFPYTLIWSWTLLYDPVLNQKLHSRNTLFEPSFFRLKKVLRNKVFGLSNCADSYTTLNTLIRFWTLFSWPLLCDPEHSYTILNTLMQFWTLLYDLKHFRTLSNALKLKHHSNFIIS